MHIGYSTLPIFMFLSSSRTDADVDNLKHRLIAAWSPSGVHQSFIDEVIDQWCKRLQACVKANG